METILSLQTPLGEPLSVCKNVWGGVESGETLSIVAGLQGDRLNGLVVAGRLSRLLDAVESGEAASYRRRGNIQIFPVVNLKAVESAGACWTLDNLDADLAFPGVETGDLTETICNAILHHTADSDFGLILQTGDRHFEEAPHARLFSPNRHLRNLSRMLGFDVVREIPDSPALGLHLAKHWHATGLAAMTLSAGRAGVLDGPACDRMFEGIVNFMLMTGLLSNAEINGQKNEARFYPAQAEREVTTREAGLFIPEISVGCHVESGARLAEVRDVYSGKTLEIVSAPEEGYLVSLRRLPLVHERETVAVLLTEPKKSWFWPFR